MDAERKVKKVTISLLRNSKFALMSGILMVGKKSIVKDMPTAATNGRDEFYGEDFVQKLDDKELGFVILHESFHKLLRQLTTWKKLWEENPMLTNMAADYVVNGLIMEMDPDGSDVAMPRMAGKQVGLHDPKYKNMNVKQVYDLLKQEARNGGGKGQAGEGFDEHQWQDAADMSEAEKKELEREIDRAIRQGKIAAKQMGNGAGGLDLALDELTEPQVDWREQLREFITSTCSAKDASSWRRVNRRFVGQDIYLPTLIGEKVGSIVVADDESGSVGPRERVAFYSEIQAIMQHVTPDRVDLLHWDAEVARHETYEGSAVANIISDTQIRGGGGTDPSCVERYIKDKNLKPECIIMLTDGFVPNWGTDWGGVPVLWCITESPHTSDKIFADNGVSIHLKTE